VACCYLLVDPSDRFVLAANYTSGSIVLASRVREDGRLEASTAPGAFVPFDATEATHVNAERQEHPHAHQVCTVVFGTIHTHKYIHIHTHIHIYTETHRNMHTCTHTHTHTHTYTHGQELTTLGV
jgi:hypothetical protein